MHIKHITVKNFRCFENLEFDLNPDINIFVGNNGSGKSAVLDAIAATMLPYVRHIQKMIASKNKDNSSIFLRDFPAIKNDSKQKKEMEFAVVLNDLFHWNTIYHKKINKGYDNERIDIIFNSPASFFLSLKRLANPERKNDVDVLQSNPNSELSVIAYYKGNRNLSNDINLKNITNQSFDRFDSLKNAFDAIANFTDLINWFFIREFEELRQGKSRGDINYELPDLKQVRNAIKTIIHPEARVYCTQTTSVKLMVEWTMETGEKRELTLNQLSAGYRNMLALVMDFARRLAQANPHLENPLEAEAILMIDELDLHLHPTWQQKIIPDLRKVFPNTQIIATTHSPEIVTTVDHNQVWILEDYQIKPCPYPTKGRQSSDIVRDVLGLNNLRPDTEESRTLTALFEAIDDENLEEAKQLQKKLQKWEAFDADMTTAAFQIRHLERKRRG
jgi:predicted ATP-binding protein involved in virulence